MSIMKNKICILVIDIRPDCGDVNDVPLLAAGAVTGGYSEIEIFVFFPLAKPVHG